jgi:hypothetical protein
MTPPLFSRPQINLYVHDIAPAMAFYARLGFVESFRAPPGWPIPRATRFSWCSGDAEALLRGGGRR